MRISFSEPGTVYNVWINTFSMISFFFFYLMIFLFVIYNVFHNFKIIITLGFFNAYNLRKF